MQYLRNCLRIYFSVLIIVVGVGLHMSSLADDNSKYGRFEGKLLLEAIGGSSKMKLLEAYTFIDPFGKRWTAPAGFESDGASIPRVAWTIIGDPWGAFYRDAAVIHDVACVDRVEKWSDVHLAFYNAMLATGIDQSKAKILYAAVYHFGPRWTSSKRGAVRNTPRPRLTKIKLESLEATVGNISASNGSEASKLERIRKLGF